MCFANRDNPNLIGYCWTDLGAWPLENTTGKSMATAEMMMRFPKFKSAFWLMSPIRSNDG